VKPGETKTFEIEKTASDGRGIAHACGQVVFVEGAVAGDTVSAVVYTVHKSYATAGVKHVLVPSKARVESFCSHAAFPQAACGGCPMSHIRYEEQLNIKRQTVEDALCRIGGLLLAPGTVKDTVGMEEPFRYRNKMVFPVGRKDGKTVGGFYAPRSHDIVPLTDCAAGARAASLAMECVVSFLNENNIMPYDEKTKRGTVRRVFVRTAYHTKEMMVVIASKTEKIPRLTELLEALLKKDFGAYRLKSVVLNVHKKPDNRVLGDKNITLFGTDTIEDTLMGLSFLISPHSFFQVNPVQTEVLYKTALDLAALDKTKTVLDIYCGIGTISLCAAKQAKMAYGVEIVPEAILDAKQNAVRNQIENAEFYEGAAEDIVPKLLGRGASPDVVILDPPRKGSDEKTLSAILRALPSRIVYVSCNPATLARDARVLTDGGYKIKTVVPVDMFPHTSHVESVALFVKEKS